MKPIKPSKPATIALLILLAIAISAIIFLISWQPVGGFSQPYPGPYPGPGYPGPYPGPNDEFLPIVAYGIRVSQGLPQANSDPMIAKICRTDHLHDSENYWLTTWFYQDIEKADYWLSWVWKSKGGAVELLVSLDTPITSPQSETWLVPYSHEETVVKGLQPYERVFWKKTFNIPRVWYDSVLPVTFNIEDADVLDWTGNRVCSSARCGDVEGWDDVFGLGDPYPIVPWGGEYNSGVAWCIDYVTHTEFLKLPVVVNFTSEQAAMRDGMGYP